MTKLITKNFGGIVCWILIIIALLWAAVDIITSLNTDNGIYPSPTNEAVYLSGEACVINMTFDRTIDSTSRDFAFCIEQHASQTGYVEKSFFTGESLPKR